MQAYTFCPFDDDQSRRCLHNLIVLRDDALTDVRKAGSFAVQQRLTRMARRHVPER